MDEVIEKGEAWVARIAKHAECGDHEAAHSEADALWKATLELIASGRYDDPQALAKMALKTDDLDFKRWCA
jgi:hypothetical protein